MKTNQIILLCGNGEYNSLLVTDEEYIIIKKYIDKF
jgi:hypothetical protein